MKKIASFLMCIPLFLGASAATATTRHVVPKGERTFYITGQIDSSALPVANGIERVSAVSSDPIHLVINSPGGMVLVGFQIEQAMDVARSRGSKVVCTVGVMAASMAFQILSHCDERYAMKKTLLLFHPARVVVREPMTADQALMVGHELKKVDKKADKENIEMMGVKDPKWLEIHNRNETLWVAEDLVEETSKKWLKIVDEIETPEGIFNLETKTGSSSNFNEKSQELKKLPWIIVNN
jgi:ATP-dependent protease ClpP protease subunit